MKAVLRVLVLFFGITGVRTSALTQSGWVWQNPLPQGGGWVLQLSGSTANLSGVSFVDANTGWAVGESTILHTTDGGDCWWQQPLPELRPCDCRPPSLRGVSFGDASTGIAVGTCQFRPRPPPFPCVDIGILLRTTDGGNTWLYPVTGQDNNFIRAVSFADAQRAIAVGDFYDFSQPIPRFGGIILTTTDGGDSWFHQRVLTRQYYQVFLQGVSFVDANTATVVGEDRQPSSAGGLILRTTDGGATWVRQTSGTPAGLTGVSFVDANTGWAVGGTILHTVNGGASWVSQDHGGAAVSFVDANTGWVVGGTILHTTDGGASWTNQGHGGTAVSFVDANTGWVVGGGGTILHTTTGGE